MKRVLLIASAALVLVLGGGVGFLALYRPPAGEPVEVEIPQGATTAGMAELLVEEDVISSTLFFRAAARLRGLDGELEAGLYEMRRGMGTQAALDTLSRGTVARSVPVTVPEGFTVAQVAARVGERTHLTEEAFLDAASPRTVRPTLLPDGTELLEGFLFPETYRVAHDADAAGLVRRMVEEFEAQTADLDWSLPESRGLSRYDALIIASLIEREARVPEDRAKIAAVIYNRLEQGMRLQIDITALYGTEHKVPTRRDLERESPYNTYLIEGLPPTPIANPGLPAIRAALDPAPIDAIYYVVVDPSGRHGFTSSFEEFQRLKEQRPEEVRGG